MEDGDGSGGIEVDVGFAETGNASHASHRHIAIGSIKKVWLVICS